MYPVPTWIWTRKKKMFKNWSKSAVKPKRINCIADLRLKSVQFIEIEIFHAVAITWCANGRLRHSKQETSPSGTHEYSTWQTKQSSAYKMAAMPHRLWDAVAGLYFVFNTLWRCCVKLTRTSNIRTHTNTNACQFISTDQICRPTRTHNNRNTMYAVCQRNDKSFANHVYWCV